MDTPDPHAFRLRRDAILARMDKAAREAGRLPQSVRLVAVSKQQDEPAVDAALAAGQRVFGENRVQEARGRWEARRSRIPDFELRLIGPLQTNKAPEAASLFDVVETLDRPSLAAALARAADKIGRLPRLYVQVNTGEEPQKAGVSPSAADGFIESLRREYGFEPEGLMCIPPVGQPAGLHFALLAAIARRNGIEHLSMGMSSDYETAIRFGATSVRLGEALFGPRQTTPTGQDEVRLPSP